MPGPTFTLVQTYDAEPVQVWHFDLYRLEAADDANELGIKEALATGISIIEWPDRLGGLIPENRLEVQCAFDTEPDARRGRFVGPGASTRPIESIAKVMYSVE